MESLDLMRTMTRRASRRRFLGVLAGGGVSLAALACSAPAQPAPAAPAPAAPAQPAASPAAAAPAAPAAPAASPAAPAAQPSPAAASASAAVKGGELVLGFRTDQPTLDPPVPNSDPQSRFVNVLYDPLVWQPQPGKFTPGLALSWEVSPDATLYTFKLRPGVKFHDGTPFNAAAVKASFDRVVDPSLKALLVGLLGPYDSTEVVDDATVRVKFKSSFPLFLHNLSATGIRPVSPAAVQKYGADFGQHAVGTGPFMLKEFSKDQVTLERFPDYNWGPEFLGYTGPAYLDRIVYRVIPEEATRLIALERGEAQMIDTVPEREVKRLQGDGKYTVDIIPVPGLNQIMQMNVTKPPLDDKQVRQAIQFAVDQEKISQIVFSGVRKPGYGILSSATPGYWKGVEGLYKYNPDKAKQLLEAAGWKPGPDGIRVKGSDRLSVLYVTTNTYDYTRTSELMQEMLKDVGIELKVDAMTNAASLTQYQAGEYNIGRLGEVNADPSVLNFPIHSRNIRGGTQGNRSKYNNPEMDARLEAAERELDPAKRLKMYEDIQQTVMDEAFILGTFEQTLVNAETKAVQDLVYDNLGRMFFHKVWLKK